MSKTYKQIIQDVLNRGELTDESGVTYYYIAGEELSAMEAAFDSIRNSFLVSLPSAEVNE